MLALVRSPLYLREKCDLISIARACQVINVSETVQPRGKGPMIETSKKPAIVAVLILCFAFPVILVAAELVVGLNMSDDELWEVARPVAIRHTIEYREHMRQSVFDEESLLTDEEVEQDVDARRDQLLLTVKRNMRKEKTRYIKVLIIFIALTAPIVSGIWIRRKVTYILMIILTLVFLAISALRLQYAYWAINDLSTLGSQAPVVRAIIGLLLYIIALIILLRRTARRHLTAPST